MRKTRLSCLSFIRHVIVNTLAFSFCIVSIWLVSSSSNEVSAAAVKYSGVFSITDTGGVSDFTIGDVYGYEFILNESAEVARGIRAFFPGAVTNFSLSLISGSWDPAGGDYGGQFLSATFANFSTVDVELISPLGFPTAGGNSLSKLELSFFGRVLSNDESLRFRLSDDLTASFFKPEQYPEREFTLTFDEGGGGISRSILNVSGEIISITASPVPVPASVFLLAPALLGLLGFKRKKFV